MHKFKLLCWVLMLSGLTATAVQAQTISGSVSDETGESLIGASILIKGTTSGTVTDIDGNFSLVVPANAEVLVVTYTGFTPQEVPLTAGKTTYTITLEESSAILGEVVVTGTGVATDTRRTAISVEAIGADELPQVSSGSVDQALVGKIPGAYIQQTSGQPGQQANIILRGINSLGGTTPMIMIDGIQVSTDNNFNGGGGTATSRLADIDFNNVERIEVVQGAAAATIYGAQGANGVIQIFTKKGRPGKARVSLNTTVGVGNPIFGDFGYAEQHAYQTDANGRILSGDGPIAPNEFGVWSAPVLEPLATGVTDNEFVEETFNLLDDVFQEDVLNSRSSLTISG
ncbi:MAG: TonB-dependent receptor plug domain-containing protein, partial [Bacteroidota bacterium]